MDARFRQIVSEDLVKSVAFASELSLSLGQRVPSGKWEAGPVQT
jgi:hypothetical protein